MNEKVLSIIDADYQEWIVSLKKRYRESQLKAAIKVNTELIMFYWLLGRDIAMMRPEEKWGCGFYNVLSKDLRESLPDAKGFSVRNLQRMRQFYELFPTLQNSPQAVAQIVSIPWGHICLIMSNAGKDQKKALFYANQTVLNNWSRSMLLNFIKSDLYGRQGKAITNFEGNMPKEGSDLAQQITKDPYDFNFLTIEKGYSEKTLKDALIENIQRFLFELGTGFAFMGREYRLNIGDKEEFIDLLFYNTRVHAYVVIEVKVDEFEPRDIGQVGTYSVAVDHLLKTDRDEKTIGLLICKDKNEVLARYALELSSQPLGISSYELSNLIPEKYQSELPSIEEIENELNKK